MGDVFHLLFHMIILKLVDFLSNSKNNPYEGVAIRCPSSPLSLLSLLDKLYDLIVVALSH